MVLASWLKAMLTFNPKRGIDTHAVGGVIFRPIVFGRKSRRDGNNRQTGKAHKTHEESKIGNARVLLLTRNRGILGVS
jgi:hypothetical protein